VIPPDESFETPVAVVDVAVVRRNAERAVRVLAQAGLKWRPHIKTHKCLQVAQIQIEAGAGGLTVATPREAEVMAQVCDDLLLAYPPVGPTKLDRVLALPEQVRLTIALDSREALDALITGAQSRGVRPGVLIEVDMGMRRVGVPDVETAAALASEAQASPHVDYRGILFYPGHIRTTGSDRDSMVRGLAGRLTSLIEHLSDRGLRPEVVSGGSTPTLWSMSELPGVTECRAGTWIYNDRDIAALGVCEPSDQAYAVCATVVSNGLEGQAVVDAGSKALAKEALRGEGFGFGEVQGRPEVVVRSVSEEHGVLDLSRSDWRPQIGERVLIVPNHVCVSVNLQDRVLAFQDSVWAPWELPARGRGPFVPSQ